MLLPEPAESPPEPLVELSDVPLEDPLEVPSDVVVPLVVPLLDDVPLLVEVLDVLSFVDTIAEWMPTAETPVTPMPISASAAVHPRTARLPCCLMSMSTSRGRH